MAVAQEHWAAKWIADSDGRVPPNSFWEGDHAIGRAHFKEGLHVGYVKQGRGLIIGWGGKEHLITHYEVLTGDKSHFHWVLCKGACRPHNFIPLKGGFESDGKELYIGRVHYNGKDRIGKAGQHLIDGMNFAVDGREMSCPEYYVFAFRT